MSENTVFGMPAYYRIKRGRGFWEPSSAMRERGAKYVACGPDGDAARSKAAELNKAFSGCHVELPIPEIKKESVSVHDLLRELPSFKSWQRLSRRSKEEYETVIMAVLGHQKWGSAPKSQIRRALRSAVKSGSRANRTVSAICGLIAKPTPKDYIAYIIEANGTGLMKIGRTFDIAQRMQAMATDCPVAISLLLQTTEISEKDLHHIFRPFHSHKEWFFATPESKTLIETIASK